jgi:virulence factor Mce-like protein
MKRALGIAIVLAAVGIALVVGSCGVGGGDNYKAAAIFDTAKGMVPGQLVKIAGARVGTIDAVTLTRQRKARIEFSVDKRFAPFRADATCRILPEGFISENYVDCNPGDARKAKLSDGPTGVPTVPVGRTSVPVSLQDLVNIFDLPTDQRLRVFVNELGIGTAGRGQDFNALLRRANPALTQANHVLAIIGDQRKAVATAVADTDQILAKVARRNDQVRTFVDRAADVAQTTAAHRRALGEGVRRLPALLDGLDGALTSVDRFTVAGSPLLDSLRLSAPGLLTVTHTLPAFAKAGVPALRSLDAALVSGRRAVRPARSLVSGVRAFATRAQPAISQLSQLLFDMRDKGALDELLRTIYALATDTASYDALSHIVTIYATIFPQCLSGPEVLGCNHKWDSPGQGSIPTNAPQLGPQLGRLQYVNDPTAASATSASVRAASQAGSGVAPAVARAPRPTLSLAQQNSVLDYLLGR